MPTSEIQEHETTAHLLNSGNRRNLNSGLLKLAAIQREAIQNYTANSNIASSISHNGSGYLTIISLAPKGKGNQ